jgi:hypothetical protein
MSGRKIELRRDEEQQLIGKYVNLFRNTGEAIQDHFNEIEEGYDYIASRQYNRKRRDYYRSQERPARSFNVIFPSVAAVLGDFLFTDQDMKVRPMPGGTQYLADLFQQIVDQINIDGDIRQHFSRSALAGMIKQGFIYPHFSTEKHIDGAVTITDEDEFDVMFDPRSRDYYFDDAAFMFRSKWWSKETLMRRFPHLRSYLDTNLKDSLEEAFWEHAPMRDIAHLARSPLFIDEKAGLYRVVEVRVLEWEDSQVFVDLETGNMEQFYLDGAKADLFRLAHPQGRIVRRPAKAKKMFTFIPSLMSVLDYRYLENQDQTHDIIGFCGYNFGKYNHLNYGLFRHRKDPQDDFNDHRNIGLDILNKMSDPGMLVKPEGLKNPNEFISHRRRPGNIGKVRTEWDLSDVAKTLEFTRIPQGMLDQSERDVDFLLKVIGPSLNFFGIEQTSQENASLFAQRVRESKKALQTIYENWKNSKKRAYQKVIRLIQLNYSEENYYRVLEKEGGMPIDIPINTNEMNQIGIGRYEIFPDTHDRSPLGRVLRFFEKDQLVARIAEMYGPTAIDPQWWLEDAGVGDMSKVIERIEGSITCS